MHRISAKPQQIEVQSKTTMTATDGRTRNRARLLGCGLQIALMLAGCGSDSAEAKHVQGPLPTATGQALPPSDVQVGAGSNDGSSASTIDAEPAGTDLDRDAPVAPQAGTDDEMAEAQVAQSPASAADPAVNGQDTAPTGMQSTPTASAPEASPPQLAVSADFLNRTLSIVDVTRMTAGATRDDALVGTVDLSQYSPGPMSLAITPDGKTALVSISGGFLGAFISLPRSDDLLLFVDLEERIVTGELDVGAGPMGIAITPDGQRAFVGLFSENYDAEVDIAARSFKPIRTGSAYNEEFSIDDSGTVGIITYGPSGNAKTFAVDDPSGSIGQTSGLSGDAAGVAFFPGTQIAYLMQAPTVLTGNSGGHDLVDVSDPSRPRAFDGVRQPNHPTTYPVTPVAARGSVAFPSTEDGVVSVVEMRLEGMAASEASRVEVGAAQSLAYGVAAAPDGRVFIAVPGDHYVGVVDLEAGTALQIPWQVTESGPTEIKLIPPQ